MGAYIQDSGENEKSDMKELDPKYLIWRTKRVYIGEIRVQFIYFLKLTL